MAHGLKKKKENQASKPGELTTPKTAYGRMVRHRWEWGLGHPPATPTPTAFQNSRETREKRALIAIVGARGPPVCREKGAEAPIHDRRRSRLTRTKLERPTPASACENRALPCC